MDEIRTGLFAVGEKFGNTQFGNNNAYCQDNEISWLDWGLLEENADLFRYIRKMIAFLYLAINAHWEDHVFRLPIIPAGFRWRMETASSGSGRLTEDGGVFVPARSVVMLEGLKDTVVSDELNVFRCGGRPSVRRF